MAHSVFISLGTNIDRESNLSSGLRELEKRFDSLRLSSVYESEAVGFKGDPFYNMVIGFHTMETLSAVSETLKQIENLHLRVRDNNKFSPRTLDLDLLLYDDVIQQEGIVIPRPEIMFNAFVLQPLAQIAPELCHPINQKSYEELWQQMDKSQKLWVVPYLWDGKSL